MPQSREEKSSPNSEDKIFIPEAIQDLQRQKEAQAHIQFGVFVLSGLAAKDLGVRTSAPDTSNNDDSV